MAKGTWHRVRNGEDLLFLAEWYYGDPKAWTHLFYANLDVYGDDFEMIPAGSPIFIPDLETSTSRRVYTGPDVLGLGAKHPVRSGPVKGYFMIEQESSGHKSIVLVFEGEGQEAV